MMSRIVFTLALLLGVPAAGVAAEFTVTQKGHQFTPQTLAVKKGDKVIFVNDDDRTHNVYSTSEGNTFDLKAQRPGARGEFVFVNAGTVEVKCAIHPTMKLVVTVE